jgi:cation diffusion facilitator family transporter
VHEGSKRAIVAAFLANLGIAIAKFVAFLVTGAASMLAESIHSLADTGNQGLLMLGGRAARRPPDEQHPFGYGTARYFWAFVVALVLFVLGGVFAIYEGIEKLLHPHELDSPAWAIGVLLFAVVLEGFSFRTALREAKPLLHGRSIIAFVRRAKSPELPVVLLEDAGALAGLVFALVGLALAMITGNPRFDAMGSLAIGLLLVAIAALLATEMASLVLGEAATRSDVETLTDAITQSPPVRHLIHMSTMHIGPEEILVAAKIDFGDDLDARALAAAIDATEARIRAAVPEATRIYIEPDLLRATGE